jgi:hypothetical protein
VENTQALQEILWVEGYIRNNPNNIKTQSTTILDQYGVMGFYMR